MGYAEQTHSGRDGSSVAVRLLRPVAQERTYRNLLYLLFAFPLGATYFAFLVGGIFTAAGLVVTLVGIPLLYVMVLAWRGLAEFERALARGLLRMELHSPPPTLGDSIPARLRNRVTDPLTWKALVYLFAKFPLGLLTFVVAVALVAVSVTLLTAPFSIGIPAELGSGASSEIGSWRIDSFAESLVGVPLGLVTTVAAVHAVNGMAWVSGRFADLLLAPPPDAALRARVAAVQTSRARIIEAADNERRRIERDLHDGAQQRLVALSLNLGLARSKITSDPEAAAALVDEAHAEAGRAITELRELARGIHPAVLTDHGLEAALKGLAARSPVPVEIREVPSERLPAAQESTVYFVVSEALANVAKYAEASEVSVWVRSGSRSVTVEVRDDGVGGADASDGTGLRGLADRVEALDGTLRVVSPPGQGTQVRAELPLY